MKNSQVPLFSKAVPNAPCGVERRGKEKGLLFKAFVPNAPCGVESFFE